MRKITEILKLTLIAIFAFGIVSCKDDGDDPTPPVKSDYSTHLTNITNNVILETYKDLANKGNSLFEAATKFKATKTASNLDAVKQAWRSARQPWEQSEGFLFGPVDDLGIDPAIDSWPVNVIDMDNLLNNEEGVPTITEAIVSKQVNEAKGFHLIEYLLWGLEGNKTITDFTDRQIDYLVAACENLKKKTAELYNAWNPASGNYVANFLKAGTGSKKYPSQKAALLDVISGMITIADEVGNTKIENPLTKNGGNAKPDEEESRFSHNSKLDFANNIKSISNVYYGKYNVSGKGISDVVVGFNANLDTQIKAEITAAIESIETIPGTFTAAIVNNRAEVKNAQKKVRQLHKTIEEKLKPLINEKL